MEQADPGGVNWTKRRPSRTGDVVIGVEADLVDVERLGAVHVGDRHGHELELHFHR